MGIKINLVALVFLVSACFILKDAPLSLERKNYHGQEIKLDGYWWQYLKDSKEPRIFVYFLYENGVALSGLSFPASERKENEEDYTTQMFRDLTLRSKTGWGIFQIENNEIAIETWMSSSGGPVGTMTEKGKLLNDTTFVINKMINNQNREFRVVTDTFYFKAFGPKPDSTNSFIE